MQDDVVVVAAGKVAYREYRDLALYICQPRRAFRDVPYMGFYAEGAIQPEVAAILEVVEDYRFGDSIDGSKALKDAMQKAIATSVREIGGRFKVVLLSATDAGSTVRLSRKIVSDKKVSGRNYPWTGKQRYIPLELLQAGHNLTSQLPRAYQ